MQRVGTGPGSRWARLFGGYRAETPLVMLSRQWRSQREDWRASTFFVYGRVRVPRGRPPLRRTRWRSRSRRVSRCGRRFAGYRVFYVPQRKSRPPATGHDQAGIRIELDPRRSMILKQPQQMIAFRGRAEPQLGFLGSFREVDFSAFASDQHVTKGRAVGLVRCV